MAIKEHYHEALGLTDGVQKHIVKGIYERYYDELQVVSGHFPHELLYGWMGP